MLTWTPESGVPNGSFRRKSADPDSGPVRTTCPNSTAELEHDNAPLSSGRVGRFGYFLMPTQVKATA